MNSALDFAFPVTFPAKSSFIGRIRRGLPSYPGFGSRVGVCSLPPSSSLKGPFKINGVPLRRVNQYFVIGTSTNVDISGVGLDKFDDKYFRKVAEKKKKKEKG